MNKLSKILEYNFFALILIFILCCYEFLLLHGIISLFIEISKNIIQRPYQIDSVSNRIYNCVGMTFTAIVAFHIPHYIIILIMKYFAKCYQPFNKKALKILIIATVISMILLFCLRLYGDLWLFRVI
jgi:hypothetical protein